MAPNDKNATYLELQSQISNITEFNEHYIVPIL